MGKFSKIALPLKGAFVIVPEIHRDHRGYFTETYNSKDFMALGINLEFVQDNESKTLKAGTIRGLHYQIAPMAQAKLVRCVKGAIFDVIVDIRPGSPTFGRWTGVYLNEENHKQILIPVGFAHGFQTLVDDVIVVYKVSALYSKEHDRAIRWDDPDIGISWPINDPILSEKDRNAPLLREAELRF